MEKPKYSFGVGILLFFCPEALSWDFVIALQRKIRARIRAPRLCSSMCSRFCPMKISIIGRTEKKYTQTGEDGLFSKMDELGQYSVPPVHDNIEGSGGRGDFAGSVV